MRDRGEVGRQDQEPEDIGAQPLSPPGGRWLQPLGRGQDAAWDSLPTRASVERAQSPRTPGQGGRQAVVEGWPRTPGAPGTHQSIQCAPHGVFFR